MNIQFRNKQSVFAGITLSFFHFPAAALHLAAGNKITWMTL
jgi:hypothetical protein